MNLLLLLGMIVPLAIASYQDWRGVKEGNEIKHQFNVTTIAELVLIALVIKWVTVPGWLLGSVMLGCIALIIGLLFTEWNAFTVGDALMFGAIGFAVPPIDYWIFLSVSMATLLIMSLVMMVRKKKKIDGIFWLTTIAILYSLVI